MNIHSDTYLSGCLGDGFFVRPKASVANPTSSASRLDTSATQVRKPWIVQPQQIPCCIYRRTRYSGWQCPFHRPVYVAAGVLLFRSPSFMQPASVPSYIFSLAVRTHNTSLITCRRLWRSHWRAVSWVDFTQLTYSKASSVCESWLLQFASSRVGWSSGMFSVHSPSLANNVCLVCETRLQVRAVYFG